ncbi:MAG TPA: NADH-quinone oxidoreductase subunit M, partial [Actinomycetales bacterium]|nr:NADH-quinone oxidoreductase subunit M [Actinomycetales bacterium]
MTWLLPALVAVPLLTAVGLLALRPARMPALVAAGLASAVTLVLAVVAVVEARPWARGDVGLDLDVPWVPALGVRMHLGLDGVSAPLVLLTCLLTLLVVGYTVTVEPRPGRTAGLLACILAVCGGAVATFMALDLVVFFVAFEVVLVPMWFLVAVWGDDGDPAARRDAANRFVLYTAGGSAVMLLGILLVALRAGTTDLVALAALGGAGMDGGTQLAAALLLLVGLAVKVPAWPLHTWLPPAHTIAPTVGSVLLAGVLLKMGSYGMVRLVVPVVPAGLEQLAPWLAAAGVIGIGWGGLACLVERDLKRLVAFSSVAHMGFVLVGIASMTPEGLQGALFANVAHGVITSLLFLVVGGLKDRAHTSDLSRLGAGLRDLSPRLGWLLALGCIAGLGLPGLAGFWGELLAVLGAWQGSAALGVAGSRWVAVLAALGTALAAAYLLR